MSCYNALQPLQVELAPEPLTNRYEGSTLSVRLPNITPPGFWCTDSRHRIFKLYTETWNGMHTPGEALLGRATLDPELISWFGLDLLWSSC